MATAPQQETFTAVSNDQLYDTWASTYDTDGNVLQAVDDLELKTLLPDLIRLVESTSQARFRPLKILDIGCGTGRNTVKLLTADWTGSEGEKREIEVRGWDASEGMLDIALRKCGGLPPRENVRLTAVEKKNFADPEALSPAERGAFDGVVSTLVLEHLPLDIFFTAIATLLRPGGYALVTNMHPEMGRTTKAGYKTSSGERVKGDSYAHGVDESAAATTKAGLEIVGDVRESSVEEGMISRGEVGERGKKWIGVKVWYGFLVRGRAEG